MFVFGVCVFCFSLLSGGFSRLILLFFYAKRGCNRCNCLVVSLFWVVEWFCLCRMGKPLKNSANLGPRQSLFANNERERTNPKSFVCDFNTFRCLILTFPAACYLPCLFCMARMRVCKKKFISCISQNLVVILHPFSTSANL